MLIYVVVVLLLVAWLSGISYLALVYITYIHTKANHCELEFEYMRYIYIYVLFISWHISMASSFKQFRGPSISSHIYVCVCLLHHQLPFDHGSLGTIYIYITQTLDFHGSKYIIVQNLETCKAPNFLMDWYWSS